MENGDGRQQLIDIADKYLAMLVQNNPEGLPIAKPDALKAPKPIYDEFIVYPILL